VAGHLGQGLHAERAAVDGQFPAEQAGLHENGAAAGDAAGDADAVRRAVGEVDFLSERLVAADKGGRRKAQEAQGVGDPAWQPSTMAWPIAMFRRLRGRRCRGCGVV
jgi:hypothetical protein